MKSATTKLLALLLASIMLFSLVACGDTGEDQETVKETAAGTAAETREPPSVAKKDYKNAEFHAIYCADTFQEGYFFIDDEDRRPGNDLDDKVYERTLAVEEYLGVDIIAKNGGIFTEYAADVNKTVSAGDDTYQLVMTHVTQDVANFITTNTIRPFNDFSSINLEASYWRQDLMEEVAINDKMFLGYNDFCLSNCYVIGFNKEMVAEQEKVVGNLYEQVSNKTWTLDKFISYTSLVYEDSNGNSKADEADTYGFSGLAWVPLISFQVAADVPIIAEGSEGELYISPMVDNAQKIVDLDQKLYDFVNANYTFTWAPAGFGSTTELHLDSGRVMFETINNYKLVTTKENEVKVGVLPYPLWDEKQADYKTLSWNGYLAIPTTVKNIEMVGDVVEMLAYYSDDVTVAFYETLLGAKVADAPEDVKMLDIIWSSQVSDRVMAFNNLDGSLDAILYAIPHHITAGKPAYATYVRQQSPTASKKLIELFTTVGLD